MSRQTLRGLALGAGLLLAVTQFLLQPSSLAVFPNPAITAVILGALATGLGFLVNFLPSITGSTAGEKPPAT